MREFDDHYEEEYVYLADLTDTAALISWGKFFFASTMELVPDRKIHLLDGQHGRHTSIGANCESYGPVDVEVRDASGTVVRTVHVADDTFTWVTGLTSRHRIHVSRRRRSGWRATRVGGRASL